MAETKKHGGKRDGAGRPSKGYKMVSIRMTDEEKELVKKYLEELRSKQE